MSRIVVSFLGKANGGMYKPTVYRHGAEAWGPSAYFGMELAQRMRPDRLVIFGTAGSMWDVLLSDQLGDAEFTAAHLELMNAAQEGRITENQLSALRPLIERAVGCKALLKLVGFAADTAGQMAILADIAAILAAGDELILDVTHGFRHLPMLALAAAAFLRHVRGVRIGGLYYGAWEMPGSPVLDLRGLLDLLDWVQALAAFDASGDLGVFAANLQAAGLEPGAAGRFVQAAFDERNQNPEEASQALRALEPAWPELHSPAFGLFQQQLRDRLAWARAESRWRREFLLGEQYLKHGDWTRAAIHATEAAVTAWVEASGGDADDWRQREAASGEMRGEGGAFNEIVFVRNALAHGTWPSHARRRTTLRQLIRDPERLPRQLQCWMAELKKQCGEAAAARTQPYER